MILARTGHLANVVGLKITSRAQSENERLERNCLIAALLPYSTYPETYGELLRLGFSFHKGQYANKHV